MHSHPFAFLQLFRPIFSSLPFSFALLPPLYSVHFTLTVFPFPSSLALCDASPSLHLFFLKFPLPYFLRPSFLLCITSTSLFCLSNFYRFPSPFFPFSLRWLSPSKSSLYFSPPFLLVLPCVHIFILSILLLPLSHFLHPLLSRTLTPPPSPSGWWVSRGRWLLIPLPRVPSRLNTG